MSKPATPGRGPAGLGARLVALLLAGRAMFRGAQLAGNVVLFAVWASADYASYSTAMGSFVVLMPLTAFGVKSALKLVPRARRIRPTLVGLFTLLSGCMAALCLGWVALAAAGAPPGRTQVVAFAGLYAIGWGVNETLVSLQRAQGYARRDLVNFTCLGGAIVVLVSVTVLLRWHPGTYLALLAATVWTLNVAHLAILRPKVIGPFRRRAVRIVLGTVLLMSAGDIASGGLVSLLFLLLAATPHHEQSSHLYLTMSTSATLLGAYAYLLQVLQPQVSVSLKEGGLHRLRQLTRGWLRLIALGGTPYVALAVSAAVAVSRLTDVPAGITVMPLYLALIPLLFAAGTANYLLENATAGSLRAAAARYVASVAAAAASAALFVPWLGAIGAVAAIGTGEAVHLLLVYRWSLRHAGEDPPPAPGDNRLVESRTRSGS